MNKTQRLTTIASLLALSILFGWIETILPSFLPNPAFKIGLSQIPILLAFYLYDLKVAAFVSILKVILTSLLFGSFMTFLFMVNLTGALVSIFFLAIAKKVGFTILLTSVSSSLGHNIGQFIVIAYVLGPSVAGFYIPFILLFSLLFGSLTAGTAALILEKRKERQ